uniref:Uncharacterized protein n=1 Tax=Panagrolaimus davidi TaxID=227884 RepID=A0A914PNW2_9BILA
MFEEIGIRVKKRFTRLSLQRKFCEEICKNLFVPKIDGYLLSRFLQMFEILEHYSIALSSPEALKFVQLKPLFISKDMTVCYKRYFLPNFKNSNVLITNTFNISDLNTRFPNGFHERIFTSIALKTLVIKAKVIVLYSTEMCLSSFLLLLSPKIVELRIDHVKITPNPTVSSFISQIPNLETLHLIYADIKYDKNWIIVLLKNCKALKYACLEFKSLYLAPECLPVVIKVFLHWFI